MRLIEAKFNMQVPENSLFRKRIVEKIEECFAGYRTVMIYGAGGSGKTTAAFQYAQERYPEQAYYLALDADDNDERRFCRYMGAMMQRAGILPETFIPESLSVLMEQTICGLQILGHKKLFIIDQINELVNPLIIDAFARFFSYLPENCRAIIISRETLTSAFFEKILKTEIQILPLSCLQMNIEEIRALFGMQRITGRQAGEILYQTEGWCGAIQAVFLYFKKWDHIEDVHEWDNPYLTKFISMYFWDTVDINVRQMYIVGQMFPYITESFCLEVLNSRIKEEQLEGMCGLGFLHYDARGKYYNVPNLFKRYMRKVHGESLKKVMGNHELIKRAVIWYEKEGDIRETLKLLADSGESELLTEYLFRYGDRVSYLLNYEELAFVLRVAEIGIDQPIWLYIKGLNAIWKNDRADFRKIIEILKKNCRCEEVENHQWKEVYLNLLYENPEYNLIEWLNIAETIVKNGETIRLYTVTGNKPTICFGTKEMTELFIHSKKENQLVQGKWLRLLGIYGQELLEIASLEYTLESNGERDVINKIDELILGIGQNVKTVDELLGAAGLIFRLMRNGHHQEEYLKVLNEIQEYVWRNGYYLASENFMATRMAASGQHGEKNRLVRWMRYGIPEQYELITRESAYINMMRARGMLFIAQYRHAPVYFKKAAVFFEMDGHTLFQARCLFGQAVALYELGDKNEAFKISARAITLGTKYRYIGIYTEYGKTGTALIEAYQKMTGAISEKNYTHKKKYYYGNVLTASYEGYHSILLRNARKEMRFTGDLASKAGKKAVLTMTEILILQYIGSGYSNKQIGELMNIQLATVKSHIYSIYKKLEVSSRVMAVNKAKELKMI